MFLCGSGRSTHLLRTRPESGMSMVSESDSRPLLRDRPAYDRSDVCTVAFLGDTNVATQAVCSLSSLMWRTLRPC